MIQIECRNKSQINLNNLININQIYSWAILLNQSDKSILLILSIPSSVMYL